MLSVTHHAQNYSHIIGGSLYACPHYPMHLHQNNFITVYAITRATVWHDYILHSKILMHVQSKVVASD